MAEMSNIYIFSCELFIWIAHIIMLRSLAKFILWKQEQIEQLKQILISVFMQIWLPVLLFVL